MMTTKIVSFPSKKGKMMIEGKKENTYCGKHNKMMIMGNTGGSTGWHRPYQ